MSKSKRFGGGGLRGSAGEAEPGCKHRSPSPDTLKKVSRKGTIDKAVLRSLRSAYADANRQAASLVRAYRINPLALIDLQFEIERGADRANAIALAAQTKVDRL